MSLVWTDAARHAVAGQVATANPGGHGWPPGHLLLAMPGDAQGLSATAFDAWCAGHAGANVTLWVSGVWLHAFSAEPLLPLTDVDLADHARSVLGHYLGDAAATAPLATWAGPAGRGACLLQGLDLAALLQSARRHRVRLRAVAPWWCGQLARALAASPVLRQADEARLLVVEHQALTVLHLARGQLQRLTQHRLDAATDAALAEAWQALAEPVTSAAADAGDEAGQPGGLRQAQATAPVFAIGHGLQGSQLNPPWQALGQLDGGPLSGPPAQPPGSWWTAWHSAPDFLQPQRARQTRRAGWAAAGMAALVLAGAGWSALQAHHGLQSAEQRLAQAELPTGGPGSAWATNRGGSAGPAEQVRAAGLAEPAVTAGPAEPKAAAGPPRGIQAATPPAVPQDTAWLAHPWAQRLAAVESVSVSVPGLRWTTLDLAADRPQVHLAGRANDATVVLQAARRLANRPGWDGLLTTNMRPLAEGGVAFEWTSAGTPRLGAAAGGVVAASIARPGQETAR